MPTDDRQTPETPIENRAKPKATVLDPRDDLREQIVAHRRELQTFFAHRRPPRNGPTVTTRH